MSKPIFWFPPSLLGLTALSAVFIAAAHAEVPAVVPGYVAPVAPTGVEAYADDTRGVYVPAHGQLRAKSNDELSTWKDTMREEQSPLYAQQNPNRAEYNEALNTLADGVPDTQSELERIIRDPGALAASGQTASGQTASMYGEGQQLAQNTAPTTRAARDLSQYPSLATGGQARTSVQPAAPSAALAPAQDGVELAVSAGGTSAGTDFQNGIVTLKEERISVRRALQRMLDQVGGSSWNVVWDLDEVNAGLPDMEISIYAEEPFIKVLNALLARLQTRSGQPLRVVKYDRTQRLVITDRVGGDATSAAAGGSPDKGADMAITEGMLKHAKVSLHYDEVPLVDALESMVNQAGNGQWRLRMYAGTDQVLKPAHIEEPFDVAIERVLKIFSLRYEIFPGGKLIVVTGADRFGFKGIDR